MFGIKRKGREQSEKIHRFLRERLRHIFLSLSGRLRYSGRSRLFKRWGRKNPRKAMMYYACFVVVILGWNVMGMVSVSRHETVSKRVDPLKLKDMFDGMMTINKNREAIQSSISDYANAGILLTMKLDSLLNLDIKSREDSLEIAGIIEKLNIKENQHQ